MKKYFGVLFIVLLMFMSTGCTTGVVPPGQIVIVAKTDGTSEVITHGKYSVWGRDRLYFIDGKLKSYTENLKILCKDKINMGVSIKWLGSFDVSTPKKIDIIKTKVPSRKAEIDGVNAYILSLDGFYNTAMKDIVKSITRGEVAPYITDSIPDERVAIESAIKKKVIARFTKLNYPIQSSDILISNLDFDPIQTAQRQAIKKAELGDELKAAEAKANVAQARRNSDLAREDGKAEVETAKANAKANAIRSASLTPQIIAMKQWEVLAEAAKGPNNSVWVIPFEALKSTDAINNLTVKSLKN